VISFNNNLHNRKGHKWVRCGDANCAVDLRPGNNAREAEEAARRGIDIYSPIEGKVTEEFELRGFLWFRGSDRVPRFGSCVIITSDGAENVAVLCHIDPIVEEGDKITSGQKVGTLTAYEGGDFGPHLHFELKLNGQWISGDGKEETWQNQMIALGGSRVSTISQQAELIETSLDCTVRADTGPMTRTTYLDRYEEIKREYGYAWSSASDYSSVVSFDRKPWQALLLAIGSVESSLGHPNGQEEFDGTMLMGYGDNLDEAKREEVEGAGKQIRLAAESLRDAFSNTNSEYSICNDKSDTEKLGCVLEVYNKGQNGFDPNNVDYSYANKVIAYFNQWKGFLC